MNEHGEPTFEPDARRIADPIDAEMPWPAEWRNRLRRLATTLSGVVDAAAMARACVAEGQLALEADAGAVFLLAPDGDTVAFGSTTGNLFISENRGDNWTALGTYLPPIYSIRFAQRP